LSISLLEEFVWSLDKTERAKLKPLKFRGKKRQLFFSILNKRSTIKSNGARRVKARPTSPLLHSMRSEILEYCYKEICPNGGLQLLTFLIERGLYRHFARELVTVERDMLNDVDNEQIEKFYLEVFKLINLIPLARLTNDVVWNKLREYPKKYIKAKVVRDKDDHYLVSLFQLGLDMRRAITEHRPQKLLSAIETQLQKIEKETLSTDNVFLRLFLNRRYIVFYKNIKIDIDKVAHYVEREAKYFEQGANADAFIFEDMSNLYRAEVAYFKGDFERSLEYFKHEYFESNLRPLRSWPVLYGQMFVLVCHIVEDYQLSRKILDEKFTYFLNFQQSPHAVLASVLFARQSFFEEDFPSARWYVDIGCHFNSGVMFDPVHDLDLKIIDNALIILSGNYEEAHKRALANLRVCSRRGYTLKTAKMPHYFKAIEEMINVVGLDKEIPKKTRARLQKFAPPFVYPGRVLQIIVQNLFPRENV
jgi:hypothetical protein